MHGYQPNLRTEKMTAEYGCPTQHAFMLHVAQLHARFKPPADGVFAVQIKRAQHLQLAELLEAQS